MLTLTLGAPGTPAVRAAGPLDKIKHIIVIYQENWSFDGLYGNFPGANGPANAEAAPLAYNVYKVRLVAGLVARALLGVRG